MFPHLLAICLALLCILPAVNPVVALAVDCGTEASCGPQYPICPPPTHLSELGCVPTPLFPPPPPLIAPIISAPICGAFQPPIHPVTKVKPSYARVPPAASRPLDPSAGQDTRVVPPQAAPEKQRRPDPDITRRIQPSPR